MEEMKRDEPESLTRRHFKRLCRVILDEEDEVSSESKITRFGRFILLSEVGRGSFGVVWKAHDPTMDRDVALKILPPVSRDEDQGRLLREVRAAARLNHPGVVSVYEMGEVEGRPFIVMDLVEGSPLGPSLKLKKRAILKIMVQLADTLQYAHEQGLVHRDIKPSNILITKEGQPVLVDFGLARTIGRDERLTMTGAIFGTPAYMSPEQAGGTPGEVDSRSDVYSLGVVLYELLGGRLPHQGSTPYEITQAILNEDPPRLTTLDSRIPIELEAITFMAMSRSREGRYRSAGEFGADLKAYLEGGIVKARPISSFRRFFRRLRQKPLVPVSSIAACGLIAVGIWVGTKMGKNGPVPTPPIGPRPPMVIKEGGEKHFQALPDLHAAIFDRLNGKPSADLSSLRKEMKEVVVASPRNLIGYRSLAQLDLLEGKTKDALLQFDRAEKAGAPLAEVLSSKLSLLITLGGPYFLDAPPGRIDFSSLLKRSDFRSAYDRLKQLGSSPFLVELDRMLSGKKEEFGGPGMKEGGLLGQRQVVPEFQLVRALAMYNAGRYPDVASQLQVLRREYPTPGFGVLLAVASLANGRVEEARRSLEDFGRIPIPPNKDYSYLKALIALEERRWEDCKDLLALLPDTTVRTYTEGLFALGRDDPFTARRLFESCGDYAPAYWQLAILEVRRNLDRAMNYLEKAISATKLVSGLRDRSGKPSRALKLTRTAVPFFKLDRMVIENARFFKPLREDPRTRDRFKALLKP